MAFNTRYLDELGWLREMGREFAKAHPETAGMLAEAGSDPDVERLLEGFAFLTARLRQKLDDEMPELTHALIEELWPRYLMPVPSACIVQFESPRAVDPARRRIARGVQVLSAAVDGTRCRFRLAAEAEVLPVRILGVTLATVAPARLVLRLRLHDGVSAQTAGLTRLRLHCAGPPSVAAGLHFCLLRHCTGVRALAAGRQVALAQGGISAPGFAPEDALAGASGPVLSAQAMLRDYFTFRERFLFVDVAGLGAIAQLGDVGEFTLEFDLDHVPEGMPQVSEANLLLGCAPVVNLFEADADPVPIEAGRSEYTIRGAADDPAHIEVAEVLSVAGVVPGEERPRPFHRLHDAGRIPDSGLGRYVVRREPAVDGTGGTRVSLVIGGRTDGVKTLSIGLRCTNRRLPQALGPGDINTPGDPLPPGVRIRNLAKPSLPLPPPIGQDLEWRLLAHLGLSQRTLADAGAIRSLLDLHDVRAMHDQQARQAHKRLVEAIDSLSAEADTTVAGGALLRGVRVTLRLHDAGFDGEGDMHLFAMVIDELVAQCASLNSFTRLIVLGSDRGVELRFAARLGRRRLI